jgi:hypothetical protein
MTARATTVVLGLAFAAWTSALLAEEKFEQKGEDEWKYEYKDEYCEVKRERKSGGEQRRIQGRGEV